MMMPFDVQLLFLISSPVILNRQRNARFVIDEDRFVKALVEAKQSKFGKDTYL
jgi:hypothetical protein